MAVREVRFRPSLLALALGAFLVLGCGDDPVKPLTGGGGHEDPTRNVLAISAGGGHTCALRSDGVAFCWGRNFSGELGDGTLDDQATPVRVAGAPPFVAISAGDTHSCGLTAGGEAYCWGDNVHGQVGGNAAAVTGLPPTLVGSIDFASISAGQDHSCGVAVDGTAWCWGQAYLGDANIRTRRATPVAVSGGPYKAITAAANYTCAIATTGSAYCWGPNAAGLLGIGTDEDEQPLPTIVAGNHAWKAIEAGVSHACGLTTSSDAYCWGRNTVGQLGMGVASPSVNAPVLVAGGRDFLSINAGELHTCAVTSSPTYCWGRNTGGQLGTGDLMQRNEPAPVLDVRFAQVSAFRGHTCGVTTTHAAYCWGSTIYGPSGTSVRESKPVVIVLPGTS